jgi:hypothetical protein
MIDDDDEVLYLRLRLRRYKTALEGLTPGGNEFSDSPETCAKWIKAKFDRQHKHIMELIQERNERDSNPVR